MRRPLSGLTLGAAPGYARLASFNHDLFAGRIVIGPWRPLWLCGGIEVQVSPDPGARCGVRVRSRFGIYSVSTGSGYREAKRCTPVEAVCARLQQAFRSRIAALEAARRERELERTSLQARLSALQA